ncbi:MAG TPA: bifunctional 23S rRNA (guanine(2069)-N(7))-methyltransferase RlmK/23S rRNA (guanine(2445)-N(2))-methyltransferase RlmL [Gammaproteobacteria bacterium]|nr:bifunctional 23S rRNA (guanine(2069)-N(7))-methyltransferase RlmK/23S rRNA (guanine(2445)-N(2))-methyltransferase RlmL [Gammaproteobacteria bacterium]
MSSNSSFFATCPKGLETLLLQELQSLGAGDTRETRAGVAFTGSLETAYRACLWSRLASRILLPLKEFTIAGADDLYAGSASIDWDEHLAAEGTLAVDCSASGSVITHSHYAALKVKDAIVDRLRERHGVRPSVDTENPGVRINVYIHNERAVLSLDLSGESLHRRGYRTEAGEAPLKENLAAAILLRADWLRIAKDGGTLVDLMCGSGTLPVEAALMAADIAPGLTRKTFGFLKWRGHAAQPWERLLDEARARRAAGLEKLPLIRGYDQDSQIIGTARANIRNAGLEKYIRVDKRELAACEPEPAQSGLIIVNPPYGERLGTSSELPALYAELGKQLLRCFKSWQAAVFTGNPDLAKHMKIRARRYHTLWNGALECRLLHFDIHESQILHPYVPKPMERSPGMEMFENRLHKNLKHLGRWARRQGITCYRLYDADLPDYNLAVDVYESGQKENIQRFVHAQEYQAPDTIDEAKAQTRWREALDAIPRLLEIPPQQLFRKQRRQQKDGAQYEKQADTGIFHEVREGPARFLVNFSDYLDTGLFLDHRSTRALIGELAEDKHFLNLFGYTGTATVHAALGGALSTTTVDMSRTYLDWAQRNLELNGLKWKQYELIQADVLEWLKRPHKARYGLIFLDPPTFSRSKRMEDTLDIQRDHVQLIKDTAALLDSGGVLIFSTNLRKFKLERESLDGFEITDISKQTLPEDFKSNPKIHQCFRIKKKDLSPRRKDAKAKGDVNKITPGHQKSPAVKKTQNKPKRKTLSLKK